MGKIVLITGGVRSGKSAYAVEIAGGYKRRAFLATAVAFDDEMKRRIEQHKKQRGGLFKTTEEPVYLARALSRMDNIDVCVIDCITVWINNLIYYDRTQERELFLDSLADVEFDVILVSNEVGMGIMPDNKTARMYADMLGDINKKIARVSSEVFLMISGLPLKIKER